MANAIIIEPLPMPAITASSTAAGFSPDYLANDFMGVVWQSPAGAASRQIIVDLGADVSLDTALLLGCVGATPSWTLQVEIASAAQGIGFAGAWVGPVEPFLAGSVQPRNLRSKALWQAPGDAPVLGRYIRFTIGGLANLAALVARIIIGQKIQLERNFRFGAAFGVNSGGSVDFSVNGVQLVRRGAKQRALGITFPHAKKDEVEEKVQPLLDVSGNDTPIAVVTNPEAHEQRQQRIYFGYLVGNTGTVWARANGFEAGINLVAID